MHATAILLCFGAVGAWTAERGRSLCAAATAQVEALTPAVEKTTAGLDAAAAEARILHRLRSGTLEPVRTAFPEQHAPTRVVRMRLPDGLRDRVAADVLRIKALEKGIKMVTDTEMLNGYLPWSLEFENNVLVNAACPEFYALNADVVAREFPDVVACDCNAFGVPAGGGQSQAYGLHHASSFAWQTAPWHRRRWFTVEKHASFHTAVTPTDEFASPFSIFDGHVPEQFNDAYAAASLLEDPATDAATRRLASLAFGEIDDDPLSLVGTPWRRSLMDWLTAAYWRQQACGPNATAGDGTWWRLEPGDALFFNNWRAHSDTGLGRGTKDRVSLDLRCYGPMDVPWPVTNTVDLLKRTIVGRTMLATEEVFLGCVLALFNYTSTADFLVRVLGEDPGLPLRYLAGSIELSFIGGGHFRLLDPANAAGLRRHYAERVRPVLEGAVAPRWDAFRTCLADNHDVIATGVPESDARLDALAPLGTSRLDDLRATAFFARLLAAEAARKRGLRLPRVAAALACLWAARRWSKRG